LGCRRDGLPPGHTWPTRRYAGPLPGSTPRGAYPADLPQLTVELILQWADEHRLRTGRWPKQNSGPVAGTNGLTWNAINSDLLRGYRSLPGGTPLAKLLAEQRGARNRANLPLLTVA
jgi:hypothetical protein